LRSIFSPLNDLFWRDKLLRKRTPDEPARRLLGF
jgi:hypothetical protein